ncbi:MAG TPA: ATP-binding protein [Bryobacteraceae bacterium]|jgi:signal transduction histidine kinase/CHASE3 domain sensor protein|nr:ATP-binding protein [Bryobacteraceae bacterium]
MPIFQPTKVRIAFGIALLMLTAAAIVSVWDVSAVEKAARQISDANRVLNRLDDVLEAFRDSVSASRGSAPDAIALHSHAVESMRSAIRDLRQGTIDNPDQQQRIRSLEDRVDQVIALERQRLNVVTRTGRDAGDAVFRNGGGGELDIQIRRTVSEIKKEEESLLSLRKEQQQQRVRRSDSVIGGSVLLGLLILFAVYYNLECEIDRRQRSQSRLIHLNRLYAFLSQTNQAIVRAGTRDGLFREICRVAVEHGQFTMAWIGALEPESGLIKPVASWGREDGYLQSVRLYFTAESDVHGNSGLASVPKDGRRVVNFVDNDSTLLIPWREEALRRGYHSCAMLAIKLQNKVVGALAVYADQPGFFDDESLRLLDEVISDISFALHTIDQEKQRTVAESEIRRLNEELEQRVLERTSQLAEASSRLAKQNEELARASHMKSEFLARMSHEFRTPLNSIIGFSDLLAEEGEGPLGEAYADYVRHVGAGAHHLLALVDEILDLSRIEAGRIDLRHEEFAAADAIFEILSVTGPLAEAKKIELRGDASPTLFAYGDRTRFKQILYNLLSNAVKFTPRDGRVQISAEADYGQIRFCVSDTGIGIALEQQTAIFEEFTQVAPATSGVKEGAGLGLTITKRIVELHGGRMWVDSTPGEGSRFFFTVPAARAGEHGLEQQLSITV